MNDPTEILTYLPKLPCVAYTDDIAHDTGRTATGVEMAIDALRNSGYRIASRVGDHGLGYGVSLVSWGEACEASRRWLEDHKA